MKTLYIVRHAEKNIQEISKDDYDIPLTKRGLEDAKTMAKRLHEKKVKPDLIVSSPALRTSQTSQEYAKTLDYHKGIMYNDVLYMAYVNELIETISYTYDDVNCMILVGHNPSVTALATVISEFNKEIPMGGLVKLEFNCDSWLDILNISKDNVKVLDFDYPR
ncbi:MAG: SixA phosphatase family protein [Campylobacterota bacterium]